MSKQSGQNHSGSAGSSACSAGAGAGSGAGAGAGASAGLALAGSSAAGGSKAWLAKICSVQEGRMTPELREELSQRQKRSSVAMSCAARAAGIQGASNRVFNGFQVGVASLSAPLPGAGAAAAGAPLSLSARPSAFGSFFGAGGGGGGGGALGFSAPLPPPTASGQMLERAMARAAPSARRAIEMASAGASSQGAAAQDEALRLAFCGVAQQEMDSSVEAGQFEQMRAMSRLSAPRLAAGGAGGAPAYQAVVPLAAQAAHAGAEPALADALEGLRPIPASDADCATGFTVFTTYLDKVTDIRAQALAVYADAGALLGGEGKAALAGSVAMLDKAENLGVEDPPPGQWIVYGMARKANTNHASISALVHALESKLALLQGECDCPMCLEPVGAGSPAHIISPCCHRTCQECWSNWSNVCAAQHKAPFCPLCRGPAEFMAVLNGE